MKNFLTKRLFAIFLVVAMIITSLSMQDNTVHAASKTIKSISLVVGTKNVTKKTFKMTKGKSKQLKAIVKPASSKKSVTYQSKNKKIVTVSKKGKLTAKKVGTAKIIVKVKGKKGKLKQTWVKIKVTKKKKSTDNNVSTGDSNTADTDAPNTSVIPNEPGEIRNPELENNTTSYTVTFDLNYESAGIYKTISVIHGQKVVRPENPARKGNNTFDIFAFDYWSTDVTGNERFDFDTAITSNIVLYAQWDELKTGSPSVFPPFGGGGSSSGGFNTPVTTIYSVKFYMNDGTDAIYKEEKVTSGNKVNAPQSPVRDGYEFKGWYTDSTLDTEYDFVSAVTKNLDLYAKWEKSNSIIHSVKFYMNDGTDTVYKEEKVISGNKVNAPQSPVREGYEFKGWYADSTLDTEYDFTSAVNENLNLYAKWMLVIEEPDPTTSYRVTFDLNDGSAGIYESQDVKAGEKAVKPISDPKRELYRFTGWYMESTAITEYNFDAEVVDNLVLYAGWGAPDGSDELYAASNTEETIFSITGINVIENNVIVTYNTNSQCLMTVEFFEDQMSKSDWSKEAQISNLSCTPVATASGYTVDYGEMVNITIPIESILPDNFIVRATLIGTGEDEDPSYVSFQYTATYKEFEAQTVDSVIAKYGEELVINFDSDRTTNFGVLKDSVKVINEENFINGFEVTDIELEEEIVPDHEFIFKNANSVIQSLNIGDVIFLEGTTWMFKIGTVSASNDGTVILTKDKEADMTDFYDVLQVEVEGSDANVNLTDEDSDIAAHWEIIDVDAGLSGSFNPSINHKFENGITLTGTLTGKVTGNVKMSYDAHMFSADYFESSVSFTTEVSAEVKASMSTGSNTDNNHEWKNVVFQVDTRKIKLPTPITGLEVYVKPTAQIDWSLSGSVSIKWKSKQTSGFKYNSDTGRTDIKKKENTVSIMAEGKAEVKVGPIIDIGIQLLDGVLSAGVVAEAGAKFTATAETGADDLLNNVDSKHACGLCVSGKAQWYATASIKLSYKITKTFKGDLAKLTILDITNPIYFLPDVPGEFFVSVLNSMDSPFGGAITFGGGSCTNKTYRTEFQVIDENDQQVPGVQVSVIKQGHASDNSGTSPYVIYLYKGTYKASASLNGNSISKTFVVSGNRQIVPLSLSSADSVLEGTIVDANDHSIAIDGASIKVSKDGVIVASAESDSNGKFSITVPEGSLKVDISKEGYLPFNSMETMYNGESHPMGLIELTLGTGMGGFRGIIRDATNNNPISGVTLKLYNGWNSTTAANTAIRTLTTNSNGEFRYDTMTLFGKIYGLPSGNYTLTATKDGYSDTSYNIVIYPGTTDENPSINETMSPSMNEGYYRIILTWGSTPSDLDSHLVANVVTGSSIHVYYEEMDPSPHYANLDVDDTTSYGPETITITNFEGLSDIRYAVHDYTNRGSSSSTAMSYSNATVRIFKGNQLLRTFQVPTGYGGTEWEVFSLDSNGRITTANSMKYTNGPSSVLGNGRNALMVNGLTHLKDYEISK